MMITLRRSFFAFLLLTVALLIGRVLLSMAFVASTVSTTLSMATGGPGSATGLITTLAQASDRLSRTLAPGMPLRTRSVLDVPAEIEARQKGGGLAPRSGGPLILTVGD